MSRSLTAGALMVLLVAGCGSSGSPGSSSSSGDPAATRAVQHALVATRNRPYHETFHELISVDTSQLPSAEAQRLNSINGAIDGTADVTDSRNFRVAVMLHGQRVFVRAAGGNLSISQDGVHYQPAPSSTRKLFSQLVGLLPGIVSHVQNARSLGSAHVSGQLVDRYTATIPGSAVAPVFSTLSVNFGSPGPLHFTLEVSRSSKLPVRVIDSEGFQFDLAKLHRPGVTGKFSLRVTSVRSFSYPSR